MKKCHPIKHRWQIRIQRIDPYFWLFSQGWFATPQEVLQADWQEV